MIPEMPAASSRILTILRRGLRRRCPQCGQGKLFRRWYHLEDRCPYCSLSYEPLEGNSYWFMYYSTAIFTGVIIISMFLVRPENLWLGRSIVFAFAVVFIVLTLPYRKGVAIALDYYTELRFSGRADLQLREPTDPGPRRPIQ